MGQARQRGHEPRSHRADENSRDERTC